MCPKLQINHDSSCEVSQHSFSGKTLMMSLLKINMISSFLGIIIFPRLAATIAENSGYFITYSFSIPKLDHKNFLCNSVLLRPSLCLVNRAIVYWACEAISFCFQTSQFTESPLLLLVHVPAHFLGLYWSSVVFAPGPWKMKKWTFFIRVRLHFYFSLNFTHPLQSYLNPSSSPIIFTIYFRTWSFYF